MAARAIRASTTGERSTAASIGGPPGSVQWGSLRGGLSNLNSRRVDQGGFARKEVSMAKIVVADALHKAVDTSLQLLGARGYSKDTPVEWMYRYARQARLVDGASEIHKMVLAESALKRGADFWKWGVDRPVHDPTCAVRAGFELDTTRLEHYLREYV